jgi:hypothetical protein
MKIIFITLLCIGTTLAQASALDKFAVKGGNVKATFTVNQIVTMLEEGKTCVKDRRKVLFFSKGITEEHCKESTKLDLRVIKVKQLPLAMFNRLKNLKPIK